MLRPAKPFILTWVDNLSTNQFRLGVWRISREYSSFGQILKLAMLILIYVYRSELALFWVNKELIGNHYQIIDYTIANYHPTLSLEISGPHILHCRLRLKGRDFSCCCQQCGRRRWQLGVVRAIAHGSQCKSVIFLTFYLLSLLNVKIIHYAC